MAQEVMSMDASDGYNWAIDVWSFGMIVPHIIDGSAPFESVALKSGILGKERPCLPDACPKPLKSLL